jgi:hypothetical protein
VDRFIYDVDDCRAGPGLAALAVVQPFTTSRVMLRRS